MKERICTLLNEKKYNALFEYLAEQNVVDIATVFNELSDEEIVRTFRLLPKETAAEAFSYMDSSVQEHLIRVMSDRELELVAKELFMDDTVDLLGEMPASLVKRILRATKPEDRKIINELLQYPEESAGSVMTTEFVDFVSSMTVLDAIQKIRQEGISKETVYTCYVLDNARHLIGLVSVKDLLLSSYDTVIGNIMETNIIQCETLEDKESVANTISKYGLLALPVVDKENRLVGIITVDDAVDIYTHAADEDFEKMNALSPSDASYFKTGVFKHASKRIVWLFVLMFSAMLTEAIIKSYETALSAIPLLASFLPMLMDTGGDSGSQSATLVIRGMATDEIHLKDFFKVFWKEFRIAFLCSSVIAAANAVRILVQYRDPLVALSVSLTLIGTVIFAKLLGGMLPMLAKRVKVDPAVMAAPLISTIVDSFSVFLYFNFAMLILKI